MAGGADVWKSADRAGGGRDRGEDVTADVFVSSLNYNRNCGIN